MCFHWLFKTFNYELLIFTTQEILFKNIILHLLIAFPGNFDFILTQKALAKNRQTEKKGKKRTNNVIQNRLKVVWQKKRKVKLVKKVGKKVWSVKIKSAKILVGKKILVT